MTLIHGFELIREQDIPEINTHARLFRHAKTGAELLSLENDDENKCFGINFRTPPKDSTGVAHIVEHAVLSGSRKYRVKEPFVELIKGSLKTFVNALTYPDKTCYPVASQNLQDFYNLIDVYLDAVFYPLLSRHTFHQEGWHYELEHLEAPLRYKGVVLNEMKGAYSDPDDLLQDSARRSLFPDTTYGLDSGGDPRRIPDLSYEQFKTFHHTFYHPSNARIFFYGDDPADERLRLMNEWLQDFERLEVDSSVALQPRFERPRTVEQPYIASEDGKCYVTVNWMLEETREVGTTLALSILGHILIGTPASPLRKALIDSGLGEDLAGEGMMDQIRQIAFSTGLKGVERESVAKVEELILQTLERLATEGIDRRTVEASLNTVEFMLREQNTGGFPRGLALMLWALTTWLYEGDPLALLAFEKPLTAIKERVAAEPDFFEALIRRYLLENPHRTTFVLYPDPTLQKRWEEEEAARLAAAKAAMSRQELEQIMREMQELRRIQETPDDPEALAAIPRLTLADLDREVKKIPLAEETYQESTVLVHDLFTNGILYLDVGMDLAVVPQDLLPYVPLYARCLRDMGTEYEDFVSLSQRIGSKTGGISPAYVHATQRESRAPVNWLFLRGKAMVDHSGDLLDILSDMLLAPRLDDRERFRQIVLEAKAAEEAGLVPAGHAVVNSRLKAHFTVADWVAEQVDGVSYLFFLRKLVEEIERDWPAVQAKLEACRELLVNRRAMLWNVTLDADNWAKVESRLQALIETIPSAPAKRFERTQNSWSPREGLVIPAQVNYVGKGANLYDLGYELHGSAHVITGYLRTTWLWERVRMQGGAYGGFCVFDQHSGVFSYLSYRDPNLTKTVENYDASSEFLRRLDLTEDELVKGIIGAIGSMDAYLLPDAKGWVSMQRHLLGVSDDFRQRVREQILSTTREDFRAFADVLDQVRSRGHVVVMGSADAIEAANTSWTEKMAVQRIL
ncbi:MAG: peptidase M16 [Caldilineae bacterium]|nr:MAG: peptidase M16 [Caldilineae bacterium]